MLSKSLPIQSILRDSSRVRKSPMARRRPRTRTRTRTRVDPLAVATEAAVAGIQSDGRLVYVVADRDRSGDGILLQRQPCSVSYDTPRCHSTHMAKAHSRRREAPWTNRVRPRAACSRAVPACAPAILAPADRIVTTVLRRQFTGRAPGPQ